MKPTILAGWVVIACAAVAHAGQGGVPKPKASDTVEVQNAVGGESEVWTILLPPLRGPEPTIDGLSARIVKLGESAVEPVVRILAGESVDPDVDFDVHPRAIERREAVLNESLKRLPRRVVLDRLMDRAGPGTNTDQRVFVVRTLAILGGRDALERALLVAGSLDPIQYERTFIQAPLERSFAAFVESEPTALSTIGKVLDNSLGGHACLLARVVTDARRPASGAILLRNLGREPRLDVELVRGIGRSAPFSSAVWDPNALDRLRREIASPDVDLARAAIEALGILCDVESAGAIVGALDATDPRTAITARRALETMAGGTHGPDPASWRSFLEAERTWFTERFPELSEVLAAGDPSLVTAAASEVLRHRLSRNRVALSWKPRLTDESPVQRALFARLLGQLGSGSAVPWLAALVEDENASVREAAGASLVQLTGLTLPADAQSWSFLQND